MKYVRVENGFVYCLENKEYGICRIGKTITKDASRQKQQVAYLPFEVEVTTIAVRNHTYVERFVHKSLMEYKTRGDWFKVSSEDFKREVNLGIISLEEDLKKSEEYNEKAKRKMDEFNYRYPKKSSQKLYECEYCDFKNYHKSMWDVHKITCNKRPEGRDACNGCVHCERFDKTIIKTYKHKNKEPKTIKSNGFLCTKNNQKMYPRLVVRNYMMSTLPDSAFENEILMPHTCDLFEDGLSVVTKLKLPVRAQNQST